MREASILRIVVASPDVQAKPELLTDIIDELDRGSADESEAKVQFKS
jgi:hypothetical protein